MNILKYIFKGKTVVQRLSQNMSFTLLIIKNAQICGLNISNNSTDNSIYYTKFTDNKLYKYNLDTKNQNHFLRMIRHIIMI